MNCSAISLYEQVLTHNMLVVIRFVYFEDGNESKLLGFL